MVNGEKEAVSPDKTGTKVAAHYILEVPAHGEAVVCLRLTDTELKTPFGTEFDRIFRNRINDADEFYDAIIPDSLSDQEKEVARQGYAGMIQCLS